MRRWGIRHLLIWTEASHAYLSGAGSFVERWRDGRWSQYEFLDADVRSATSEHGSARLVHTDPLSAEVALNDVVAGDQIVVRTNFYPAWEARARAEAIPLYAVGGQLAFTAPAAGSYRVRLEYPRRRGLSILALTALLTGMVVLAWTRDKR